MSANQTISIENGERVYPCRCGETHRGDYAAYDYAHHNCFHDEPLHQLMPEDEPGYLMCPSCGKTFWVDGTGPTAPNTDTKPKE